MYVSNTRVVIYGTTYATANITSVRKHIVPARSGCALVLAIVGGLGLLGALPTALAAKGDGRWVPVMVSAIALTLAIVWFRLLRPTFHVMVATAGGERPGLTSKDDGLADRVTAAIADAIVHRG
ncbi:MAG: DUF6232 family protein [Acidobacteriota bacterium]